MRYRNRVAPVFGCIAAAALLAPASVSDTTSEVFVPDWMKGRIVEAMGRSFIEVAPNRSRFTATFQGKAKTSAEASETAVEMANAATAAMRKAANDKIRISANLTVTPYYEQVTRTTRYGDDQTVEELVENVYPEALLGYVAEVVVSVTMLDPDRTSAVRAEALARGPVRSGEVYFFLEPTAESQQAAFSAAADDARKRAELAATAMGASLGEPLLVREGFDSCLGQATTQAGMASFAKYASPAPPPPPPPPPSSSAGAVDVDAFSLAADPSPSSVDAEVCAIYALD